MRIRFKQEKIKAVCESVKEITAFFKETSAKKIMNRLAVLEAASALIDVSPDLPIMRHQLNDNSSNEFSVVIEDGWRIVFVPDYHDIPKTSEGDIALEKVTAIMITGIRKDSSYEV